MTITRRPPRPIKPVARPLKSAESFIENASHPLPEPAPVAPAAKPDKKKAKDKGKNRGKDRELERSERTGKKRKDKEAVLIRFDDEQLTLMDARAAALGLSRAAWLRMLVAKALMDKKR
jgi:hypothetical protein